MSQSRSMSASEGSAARPLHAWIVVPESPDDSAEPVRVWNLTSTERLERALRRSGTTHVEHIAAGAPVPVPTATNCPVFRSDYFYDERLIAGLLDAQDVLLVGTGGEVIAGNLRAGGFESGVAALRRETETATSSAAAGGPRRALPEEIAPAYNPALRKLDPPFVYKASRADARDTENSIFASSYKGITDLVTKWVFPLPARAVVRVLAKRGVHPNSVTAIGYLLTLLAAWLFYQGWFALGLAAAWSMTFLDTVDGKLARVTLTSSPIGNVLDHGLDLVHPPIWWAAWAYGLAPGAAGFEVAMWIVVGGYVTGRLLEGVFMLAFGMEIFTWRPFDAFFRTIIARRNPNLLLLTAGVAIARPGLGFIAVAAWTIACHIVPIIRIIQAFSERRRGVPIRPWYEEQSSTASTSTLAALLASVLLLAQADPAGALGPRAPLDPAAKLPSGSSASEYWDLTAQLDSGHRVFARFMITNVGPGDQNATAVGHVVEPDGTVHAFHNGRRKSRWKLSDDRLYLDIGRSELDLHAPDFRLDIHKPDLRIDLRFTPSGSAQPPAAVLPHGYSMDILDPAAAVQGSLWLPKMSEPLAVRGRVGVVHTWLERPESELVLRRIEFFSLQEDRAYVLAITTPQGDTLQWFCAGEAGNALTSTSKLQITLWGSLAGSNDEYATPGALILEEERVKGRVRLDRNILSHDSLSQIPPLFRFFMAREMRPWRVWAESRFDVTLRANPELSPSQLVGSGISVVTFSSPISIAKP